MPFKYRYLLLFFLLNSLFATTYAADRVALVIGNNNYTQKPLKNPVNDARAMTVVLEESGFHVLTLLNADLKGMQEAMF